MTVTVTASVQYACYLSMEDEEMVREYADAENCTFKEAVANLYADGVINLYYNSTESDFSTESIDNVEE